MATKAGEIELDVRLTGDDISKTLHKISDSITKKFDSAFSSLSKDFENVSTDMKQSFSKVAEGVSQKTEKEFSNIKGSGEQLSNSVSSSFKKIGMAVVAAFSVAKIKEFGQQCIESAAEVNAANSQFEQTFGTMQSQAESAIQSVADQSGILETRLQGVGTSIYAFAKTTGMDSSSALGMMQEALQQRNLSKDSLFTADIVLIRVLRKAVWARSGKATIFSSAVKWPSRRCART